MPTLKFLVFGETRRAEIIMILLKTNKTAISFASESKEIVMRALSVLGCLVLIFTLAIVTGCRTAGIMSAQGPWDKYLLSPFPERVFEADAFILENVKRMNLATQKAYPFTQDENSESAALSPTNGLYGVISKTLGSLDPKITTFIEDSFIGVFPVTNIINGVGTLVPVRGANRQMYYILFEYQLLYMFINGGIEGLQKTRYTYDYDLDDFFNDSGNPLTESDTASNLDETRQHYRRMVEAGTVGILFHELGHLVHYRLTEGTQPFRPDVYVPREFFELSWTVDSNGRVVSRFVDKQKRIAGLDMRSKDSFTKSVEILRETNLSDFRSFMDPEEDFATAFAQYAVWRSGLKDSNILGNCVEEERFAAKKQYFDRLFTGF